MPLAEIPLRAWHKRAHEFVFRGHTIRYWVAGQGEPLLLIHGFPTASWDWHYLWQPLAQRNLVIACDMLGFGESAKPLDHDYCLLEQADLQQALLDHLRVEQPVFLNGGLFPETHRPALVQKLLLSPLGWMIGRAFGRNAMANSFSQIFGPNTRPSESALDDFWSLINCNDGTRILHKLIAYIPQRRRLRERWVDAMQRGEVPLRVIDGEVDPISGAHMVARYHQLVPHADTVSLANIGHYPQIEAPVLVLKHYLAFRERLGHSAPRLAHS